MACGTRAEFVTGPGIPPFSPNRVEHWELRATNGGFRLCSSNLMFRPLQCHDAFFGRGYAINGTKAWAEFEVGDTRLRLWLVTRLTGAVSVSTVFHVDRVSPNSWKPSWPQVIGGAQAAASRGQIAVVAALQHPFNFWTDRHGAQGLARRPGSVSVRTLAEDGPLQSRLML